MTLQPPLPRPDESGLDVVGTEVPGFEAVVLPVGSKTDLDGNGDLSSSSDRRRLTRLVGRGAAWTAASSMIMRVANLGVMAVVARLLDQEAFGIFAIALAVFMVVSSLAELGMASAIARSPMDPDAIAPTVATISVVVSLGLAAAMAMSSPLIAEGLGQPGAAPSIRVLSLSLALTGVFAVPGAQLSREFRQDRIFLAAIAGFVPANAVLIVMSMNGAGALAFAWSRVLGQLITGLVLVLAVNRHYWFGLRRELVGPLLRFGLPLSAANLVSWTLLNADFAIVGRFLSAAEVGIYSIAFSVASWPTAVLGSVLNGVVVPAFGRVQHDRERLGTALISATQLVALVALPIGVVTIALSRPLIATVFGVKWLPAAPVLVVLAGYGILFAFSLMYANVLVACGRTTRLLTIQVLWIVCLVPSLAWGVTRWGILGAGYAHVLAIACVTLPAYVLSVRAVTDIPARDMLRAARRPAVGAVVAGFVAFGVGHVGLPGALQLVTAGCSSVVAYAVVVLPTALAYAPENVRARARSILGPRLVPVR